MPVQETNQKDTNLMVYSIPPQSWESISMDFIEQLLESEGYTVREPLRGDYSLS